MSLMGLRRRFARHLRIGLWLILIGFVLGIFFLAFLSGGSGRRPLPGTGQPGQEDEVIAVVGEADIMRSDFERVYLPMLQQQASYGASIWGSIGVPLNAIMGIRYRVLQDLASTIAMAQEARNRGFEASPDEVDARIRQEVNVFVTQVQEQGRERDPRAIYRDVMASRGVKRSRVSEKEFRDWMTDTLAREEHEQLIRVILLDKLRASIIAPVQLSEADFLANYDEAQMTPIVFSFSAGEEEETKADAKKRAEETHSKLKSGADFDSLAKSVSDIPQQDIAAEDWVSRGNVRAFFGEEAEKALFALKPGEFSAPAETSMGYVIFRLDDIRRQLPEDFSENKEEYRRQATAQRQNEVWGEFSAEILEKLELQPRVPEVAGMKALEEGKRAEAMAAFEEAFQEPGNLPGEVFAAICYELGSYYFEQEDLDKAKEKFEASLSPRGDIPERVLARYPEDVYLALGKILLDEGNREEALSYLTQVDFSDDYIVHMMLLDMYEEMGETEKAAQQTEWLEEYRKIVQEEQERAMMEAAEQAGSEELVPSQNAPEASPSPTQPVSPQEEAGP
ncbi:MAG: tetratricopeptide repeat protein [Armatimonadetes bacterium]|nr:tetratricopeptide repeat protein [Armatimonadota bacterium]NIM24907.1 tetratricopeptide repeat protein [Armatimonadota bacterium]NIM68800.1 tetratricopeptide repeat protein [Armatimonadota bacterium]NIM77050.1 tetratricopeptide repeat protein [Armatimonadota bacterium]NIN06229.1 tetratricopeptide repeat protein [Armatimonadota bacterium]